MKNIPIIFSASMVLGIVAQKKNKTRRKAWSMAKADSLFKEPHPTIWQSIKCGDMLWVREGCEYVDAGNHPNAPYGIGVKYKADGTERWCGCNTPPESLGVKSPIHMHQWASRITLRVIDVRIESLQDITEEDSVAEGFKNVGEFADYWNELHPNYQWWPRPDVVVIGFEVEEI